MTQAKRLLALLLMLVVLLTAPFAEAAKKKSTEPTPEPIPEPTLSPDAPSYDADHPELLQEDQLYASAAYLMEAESGLEIFSKNPDTVMYPASTTKILTVLLGILMVDDLDQTVTVSDTAMNIPADSSTMNLEAGEEINYTDLLYGTMMRSANEGANVIAETVAGSIDAFVELMNQSAANLGCTNTHFANPHGYHDNNHYTTVHDMAIIAREAMKNETFRSIAKATSYRIAATNKHRARAITTRSTNMLPGSEDKPNKYYYEYATGIKTGSHTMAGYCFVGSANKEDVELISVVFFTSNRGRWTDTKKLMEYGFSQYVSVTPMDIYKMNPITLETNNYSLKDADLGKLPLNITAANSGTNLRITATKEEVEAMAKNLKSTMLIQYSRDFAAPIEAGEVMGTLTYYGENGQEAVYQLIAGRSIAKRENAPKTLEEIVQEAETDPNPLPPISLELVLTLLLPVFIITLCIVLLRKLLKKARIRNARIPKPKSRYLK